MTGQWAFSVSPRLFLNHTTSYGMVVSCRVKTTVKFLEYYGNMQKIPVSVNDKILNKFMPVSVKGLGAHWEFWDY